MPEVLTTLPDPVALATPLFVALIIIEMIYGRMSRHASYEPRDTGTSMIMGLGSLISGGLLGFVGLAAYLWAYEYRIFDLGFTWWAWVLCLLAEDLAYYVFHRFAHRVRWFWASHVIHHTSQHYNLSTALRQSWTSPFSARFIFRMPLFLIGFEPAMILFSAGVNLVYQFWIHTEAIGKLGPLEWVLNTPSHHRVHHATNARYLDSNYAGALIIWDRWFGSFVEEEESDPPHYGIIRNLATYNPLKVAIHEWVGLLDDLAKAASLREMLGFIFAPPGWSPDGSRLTSDRIKARWRARKAPERTALREKGS